MARIAESGIPSTSFLVFCCFDIKNQTASLDCSLLGLGERRGREGTGQGEEEGSDEPSALEGSLAAGGGHSGRGPAVGFARLAAGLLLPHSFLSQVTCDRACGGLGRLRVLWGLQHCGHERESGLPKEEASPPVSRVCFGETRVVGMASPGYSALPQELLLEVEPRWRR